MTGSVDGSDALEYMNQEMKAETKSHRPSKYDKIGGGVNLSCKENVVYATDLF